MGRKTARLYKINDLVNLRLTKDRDDIMKVLNAKKMQGEDVSEYIANAIRTMEGLPSDGAPVPDVEIVPTPPPQPLDTNQIVQQVIAELSRQGMVVAAGGGAESADSTVDPAKGNKVEEGVFSAVARIMNFGDDDDDD